MSARNYGSKSDHLKGRDPVTGELPAAELTDQEIAQRISEKIQLQALMSRERGTRVAGAEPAAPTLKADPEEAAALAAEMAQAQADLAALEAAEKEARKAEAEVIAQADRERKDRKRALQDHAEAIRVRVAEVEQRARAEKLKELASEHAAAPQRNAQHVAATIDGQRAELERLFRPILNEIAYVMQEGRAFLREHGPALEKLAALTFSTSPAEYPVRTRQRLSSLVYRPAERLLEYVNDVLRNDSGYGHRWDASMEAWS